MGSVKNSPGTKADAPLRTAVTRYGCVPVEGAAHTCILLSSADGNYIISCGSDKSLKLWSVTRGTLLKTYSGHGYEVLDADG